MTQPVVDALSGAGTAAVGRKREDESLRWFSCMCVRGGGAYESECAREQRTSALRKLLALQHTATVDDGQQICLQYYYCCWLKTG